MQIDAYELEETVIRDVPEGPRKAIRVFITGRHFDSGAIPVMAFVGEQMVQFLRLDPTGRWLEGVLLEEPADRDPVDVVMGADHVRHPDPLDRSAIRRIDWQPDQG